MLYLQQIMLYLLQKGGVQQPFVSFSFYEKYAFLCCISLSSTKGTIIKPPIMIYIINIVCLEIFLYQEWWNGGFAGGWGERGAVGAGGGMGKRGSIPWVMPNASLSLENYIKYTNIQVYE